MSRTENGPGLFVPRRPFLGWSLWDLCSVLDVFLPVFMDYFRESREKTGKYNAEALLVRKYPSNLKVEVKA